MFLLNMNQSNIVIPLHFDTEQNSLDLDTFINTTNAVEHILNILNQKIFERKINYRIYVLPPEPGSFKQKLAIVGTCIGGALFFLDGDTGKAFFKGLTGHEPSYWSENAGENIRELILLKEATKGILQKDVPTLIKIGLDNQNYEGIYNAKNQFYKACIIDEKINAVGFDNSDNFSVTRSNFIDHTSAQNLDLVTSFDLKIHDLIIVSPITAKKIKNMWRTVDKNTKEKVNFYIKDDEFYLDFIAGLHPIKASKDDDEITALIRYEHTYKNGVLIDTKKYAIKIFRFNGTKIADFPENLEDLNIKFNEKKNPLQMDIFEPTFNQAS